MKAIVTKYHGPGNTRGSRYSASDSDGNRVYVSADNALNSDENHREACRALLQKMGWKGDMVGGYLGNDMVGVFTTSNYVVSVIR